MKSTGNYYFTFSFDEIDDGDYVLAFRDARSDAWLPTVSNTGMPKVGSAVAGNGCTVPLTLERGQALDLGQISLGDSATSSCTSPWGTGGVFSGKVTNMTTGAATEAVLSYITADDDTVDVDRVSLSETGEYSFAAITKAGTYYVEVIAGQHAPYFDTYQGGLNDFDADNASIIARVPKLAENASSPDNDVTLIEAAIVTGTVTSKGTAVRGASVDIDQADDTDDSTLTFGSAITDPAGHYEIKLRPAKGYVFEAYADGFDQQYFGGTGDRDDATLVTLSKPGRDTRSFNFSLLQTVAHTTVGVIVPFDTTKLPSGVKSLDDLHATLYRKVDGHYMKALTVTAEPAEGFGLYFQFPADSEKNLVAGDYRMRFSNGKRWIPMAAYESTSDSEVSVQGPVCVLPVVLAKNDQKSFFAFFDFADTSTKCGDEPTKKPAASSGSSTSGPAVVSSPADPVVIAAPAVTATPAPTVTPTPTPTPTVTVEPTTTPEPTSTATDAPVAAPQNTSDSGNLTWIYVVGGIVLAAIIAGLIIMVARRQAAAGK